MPFYENVFIARQDITAQHAEALAEQFSAVIVEKGGKVEKQEQWGLRNLSYRIKKNRKGYYVRLNIDGPAEAIQEMERQMRLNEDIIRHMTVRVEALDDEQAAVLQSRGGRDERGGRDDRGPRGRDRGDRDRGDRGDRDRGDRDRGDRGPRESRGPETATTESE